MNAPLEHAVETPPGRPKSASAAPARSLPDPSRSARRLALALGPATLVLLVLLLSTGSSRLAPEGLFGAPWELLAWCVVAATAALHRPLSEAPRPAAPPRLLSPATLGLGAFVLPAVLSRLGAAPAALVAALALALSEVGRRAIARRLGERRRVASPGILPTVERAGLLAIATLVAGASTLGSDDPGRAIPLWTPLVYGAALAVAIVVGARLHGADGVGRRGVGRRVGRRARDRPSRSDVDLREIARPAGPVALDLLGWALGLVFVGVSARAGWSETAVLWPIAALLVAEAARQALLRDHSATRIGDLERLQEAHERILSEASGTGAIAQQILTECRNILDVGWYHFELHRPDGVVESWAAGPDGLVVEGRPKPPPRPGALPGIHRRVDWRLLEKPLVRSAADGDEPRRLATVRLWVDPRRVEPGAEELFETLIPQMASSVDRALLDREAKLDPLTGVPVRRVLESSLQRTWRRACDDGRPMAVIMCDIDFFKKVNDVHGHAAGDEALKLVAATLDATRRESDLCCRYGGEEFTVLLEDTDGMAALRLAERLRRAVEALDFVYDGRPIPLTLSLGVASFPELYIKTPSELLLLADEALYAAKEAGRNRCLLNAGLGDFHEVVRREEAS